MTKTYTFTLARNRHKEFFWRIVHKNGEQICRSSETYKNKKDCITAFDRLRKALKADDYEMEIG